MRMESDHREAVVRYLQRMDAKGWVANHDGNLSVRLSADRFLCTPTGMAKSDIKADELIVVSGDGSRVRGQKRLFSEWILHRTVYESRPEVNAVCHSHAPYATAFGAAGQPLPHPFLPEAVVSLGPNIPSVKISAPGIAAAELLKPELTRSQSCLIEGNGLLSWGTDLEQAFLRMELVEHLASIAHLAQTHGGVRLLPNSIVETLTAKHIKANLAAPEVAAIGHQNYVQEIREQVHSELRHGALATTSEQLASVVAEVTQATLLELKTEK